MKVFTDTTGRNWTLSLTLGAAMAVKEKLDIDLLQPEAGDPPLLTRLGTDEILLGEVLCVLMQKQFEAYSVTEDDVRDSFDGKTLCAAQDAFYQELIDFFQSRGRTDRAKAVAKQAAMIKKAVEAIGMRVDGFSIDEAVHDAMNQTRTLTPGPTSGDSPEPSEPTPAR